MATIDFDHNINNLYNYLYKTGENKCFKLLSINKKDIEDVDTIKFTYKHRSHSDRIITDILQGKLKLTAMNEDLGRYFFKRNSNNSYPITVVMGTYDKSNENINDLSRKENVEITVSYLLSELVVNNKTKHIILPINNVDVKMSQISDIINNYPSFHLTISTLYLSY